MAGLVVLQIVLIVVLLVLGGRSSLTTPVTTPTVNSLECVPEDVGPVCKFKRAQCAPLTNGLSGPLGPVTTLLNCAKTAGIVPNPIFFMSIGLAFIQDNPEALGDHLSSSPTATTTTTTTTLNRCVLRSAGLTNLDLSLNRTAVREAVSSSLSSRPALGAAVAAAVSSCPEPMDYSLAELTACLKKACMNSVQVPPFMMVQTPTSNVTTNSKMIFPVTVPPVWYPGAI